MSSVAGVLVILALLASIQIRLPYYAIAPGSAREVTSLIHTEEGAPHYPPEGRVLLTTVSLGDVHVLDALIGWIDPDTDVVHRDIILPPDTSGDEYRELNQALMEDSQLTAVVVALRKLGHDISERGEGGLVAGVLAGYPADGRLTPGDVIIAVDGTPTPLSQDVVAAIRAHQPGDVVRVEVTPRGGGERRIEELRLATAPGPEGGPFLGVEVRTAEREFDVPYDVQIDAGSIGGPSAGLAFTLAVIDVLSPGELTGGQRIAVTGTIAIDGTVGAVGGVAQKAAAVRDAGIGVFLVPAGEAETARRQAGAGVRVIAVDDLDDALAALGDLGGDLSALAPPPAPAS